MFWEKKYQPAIVGCKLTDEELTEFLKEKGVGLSIVDNPTRWCAFAHYYTNEKGFNIIKATSFAYMISLFMTGMGISAGTEMYFKEEQMEYDLIDYLNQIKYEQVPEEENMVKMFHHIFKIYSEEIDKYEYSTERLSFKLTPSQMEKFQAVAGKNNKEKFLTLLSQIKE